MADFICLSLHFAVAKLSIQKQRDFFQYLTRCFREEPGLLTGMLQSMTQPDDAPSYSHSAGNTTDAEEDAYGKYYVCIC